MNVFDLAIIAVIVVSAAVGVLRGLIRETLSLVSWILALWLAFVYAEAGAVYFENYIQAPALRVGAAFVAIFVLSLLLLTIVSYLIHRMLRIEALVGTDRVLGGAFGVARALVIIAGFMLLGRLTTLPQEAWWRESVLAAQLAPVVTAIYELLPPEIAQHLTPG